MPASLPVDRFARHLRFRSVLEDPFVELDLGLAGLIEADVEALQAPLGAALSAMQRLEQGSLANKDEQRMVGHFWLRAPGLSPSTDIEQEIVRTLAGIEQFAADVHAGRIAPPEGGAFTKVVLCGIGGSALGPMLLADVFGGPEAPMSLCVLDNTDPDGIDRALEQLGALQDALVVVISKSGGTPETRNGMLEVERACKQQGLVMAPRAIAVTMPGSALARRAEQEGWLSTFPMWDWVGGRTSITSAVGLLPGALLGMDLRAFLAGAAAMDDATRRADVWQNPAAMLSVFWHHEGKGRGERAMVVLPYKDRMLLLSRYLQQLVMESLGKEHDRQGRTVNQGLAVYGNKGSTDQHAYVQQLRDGRHDFFALFLAANLMYSSAIFERADMTLEQAQTARLDRICLKLALRASDHLLEIGTGWGGMALHAARHYGCRVTTTTISKEQYDAATQRVRAAGLGHRIKVLLQDYRDLRGVYDKLVSLEMIEAVGHAYYDTYFAACSRLLAPDGLMLLQAITIADQRYESARRRVAFIQRHIFPGSCIPSVATLMASVARASELRLIHMEDIGPHYASTLRLWRERFFRNLDHVRALGYSGTFIRMWEFYLCYCEGGFRERAIGDAQMLLAGPDSRCESRPRGPYPGTAGSSRHTENVSAQANVVHAR